MHPMHPMRLVLTLLVVLALAGFATPSLAQTPGHKFGRGVCNLTMGILELPGQMVAEGRRGGPLWAFSLGFAKGVGRFVTRELVGVYEIVTFPAPVPRGYRPILSPTYPWEVFD
jgi:putative exosortase-associated protein (TIGR04073 family)